MPEERDIGAELYELVRADFERYLEEQSPDLPDMSVANMKQADSYAHLVGRCLALAIAEHVKPEVLPDGRLYYNIAEKILDPTLRENHRLVNEFCGEIQKLINERQGINIRPQTAKYPEERAHSLINAAAHEEDWDKTERILDDSVRTLTDSFYADNVKANADLRSKAGLRVEIVREGGSKCCPWCADLAGRYAYPDEVPKDVYRRHDNCTCSVTYVNGRARQNVWTKAQWQTPAERAERIALAKNKAKPTRFTGEQASAFMERVGGLTRFIPERIKASEMRLTGGANGDRIKAKGYAEDNFDRKVSLLSIAEDLKAVNPNYKYNTPYGKNCQRCVPTYFLRRKGFKVEALPTGKNPEIDTLLFHQPHIIWEKGGKNVDQIQPIGSKYFGKPEIINAMRDLPDGAMFEIRCEWKDDAGAHVFVAEKIGGKTHFLDPQNGEEDVSYYFSKMKANRTSFWRIDDAHLREDLIQYCCKSEGVEKNDT